MLALNNFRVFDNISKSPNTSQIRKQFVRKQNIKGYEARIFRFSLFVLLSQMAVGSRAYDAPTQYRRLMFWVQVPYVTDYMASAVVNIPPTEHHPMVLLKKCRLRGCNTLFFAHYWQTYVKSGTCIHFFCSRRHFYPFWAYTLYKISYFCRK